MRFEEYQKAANAVSSRLSAEFHAKTAVVLGSGLGGFANVLEDAVSVPFCEIPGAPAATNPAHKGELLAGTIRGVPVYLLSGRVHAYEGYSLAQTAFFVRVLFLLGVKNLILTCAAGGISPEYSPGDFVCISDHLLYFFDDSPVRGEHLPEFGERFFDMTHAYDESARAAALETMTEMGIFPKQGVYAYMPVRSMKRPQRFARSLCWGRIWWECLRGGSHYGGAVRHENARHRLYFQPCGGNFIRPAFGPRGDRDSGFPRKGF